MGMRIALTNDHTKQAEKCVLARIRGFWPLIKLVGLLLALALSTTGCGSDTAAPKGDGGELMDKGDHLRATYRKSVYKEDGIREIELEVPKEHVSSTGANATVVMRFRMPEFKSTPDLEGVELSPIKQAITFPPTEEVQRALTVTVSPYLGHWHHRPSQFMTLAGPGTEGLTHYKWDECKGKPFDPTLLRSPSFEDGCYSLNREDYYISSDVGDGRIISIKCGIRCVVESAITKQGFGLVYSYPAGHLPNWREIDQLVFNHIQELVVSQRFFSNPNSQGEDNQ
ncbi:MAG: hypothetical protein AAGF57_02345 [Pseudomonadota bacterium]